MTSASVEACMASITRRSLCRSSTSKHESSSASSSSAKTRIVEAMGSSVMSTVTYAENNDTSDSSIGSMPFTVMRKMFSSFGSSPFKVRCPSPRSRMRDSHSLTALSQQSAGSDGCRIWMNTTSPATPLCMASRISRRCCRRVLILSTIKAGTSLSDASFLTSARKARLAPLPQWLNSSWFTQAPPNRCRSIRHSVLFPDPIKPATTNRSCFLRPPLGPALVALVLAPPQPRAAASNWRPTSQCADVRGAGSGMSGKTRRAGTADG
mmetsp:Transcript_32901/g.94545  ORF Transcript_32901/g.94545 Transcript_32901/m.94545 type:complete len:266 (+) Transcript_32901:637-1434(+)